MSDCSIHLPFGWSANTSSLLLTVLSTEVGDPRAACLIPNREWLEIGIWSHPRKLRQSPRAIIRHPQDIHFNTPQIIAEIFLYFAFSFSLKFCNQILQVDFIRTLLQASLNFLFLNWLDFSILLEIIYSYQVFETIQWMETALRLKCIPRVLGIKIIHLHWFFSTPGGRYLPGKRILDGF